MSIIQSLASSKETNIQSIQHPDSSNQQQQSSPKSIKETEHCMDDGKGKKEEEEEPRVFDFVPILCEDSITNNMRTKQVRSDDDNVNHNNGAADI